jgi:putative intracellular protease/amidase
MATVAMPIPSRDFDPTEVAVSWQVLTGMGHRVVFATPDGQPGAADQIMLDGIGLDPWGKLPGLKRLRLIGLLLRANKDARQAYSAMLALAEFQAPRTWDDLRAENFDGLVLPGGHRARGMREYLESTVLQRFVAAMFAADKPVGAICHGVLLAARSVGADGRSVLYGRKTTALLWAQEKAADGLAKIGRWWDPNYYRTYDDAPGQPQGYMSVEQEVTRALARPEDFLHVPADGPDRGRKTSGLHRDSARDPRPGWVVVDGNYVSARWPGDAHMFARTLGEMLSPS